jgi:proteasome assembly chaperone (PAC2) family protein
MGIKLYKEPGLEKPELIVGWPGIGNIGIIAVNVLKEALKAEEFGEIEPWDFFYPKQVLIEGGLLKDLRFSTNKFYFKRLLGKDLIIFIGEEQPTELGRMYAAGEKAYQMANLVLDVGLRFGCRRVYTSGACVSPIHHEMKPRVISVASSANLIMEMKKYKNLISMSEIEPSAGGEGTIAGLNGLLLAVAKKKGLEGICLMGEIPDWLSRTPFPFPKASKSVLEVFADILEIGIDLSEMDNMANQIEEVIANIYKEFPSELRESYDRRKFVAKAKPKPITDEEAKWLQAQIDEIFKKGKEDGERPV